METIMDGVDAKTFPRSDYDIDEIILDDDDNTFEKPRPSILGDKPKQPLDMAAQSSN